MYFNRINNEKKNDLYCFKRAADNMKYNNMC